MYAPQPCSRNAVGDTGYVEKVSEEMRKHRLHGAAEDMLALLIESQTSIGGDWRDRRDAAIKKARGDL